MEAYKALTNLSNEEIDKFAEYLGTAFSLFFKADTVLEEEEPHVFYPLSMRAELLPQNRPPYTWKFYFYKEKKPVGMMILDFGNEDLKIRLLTWDEMNDDEREYARSLASYYLP